MRKTQNATLAVTQVCKQVCSDTVQIAQRQSAFLHLVLRFQDMFLLVKQHNYNGEDQLKETMASWYGITHDPGSPQTPPLPH